LLSVKLWQEVAQHLRPKANARESRLAGRSISRHSADVAALGYNPMIWLVDVAFMFAAKPQHC